MVTLKYNNKGTYNIANVILRGDKTEITDEDYKRLKLHPVFKVKVDKGIIVVLSENKTNEIDKEVPANDTSKDIEKKKPGRPVKVEVK